MAFFAAYFKEQEQQGGSTTSLEGGEDNLSSTSATSFRGIKARRELRIAVQCDVTLFRYLMQFAHRGRESVTDGTRIEAPDLGKL